MQVGVVEEEAGARAAAAASGSPRSARGGSGPAAAGRRCGRRGAVRAGPHRRSARPGRAARSGCSPPRIQVGCVAAAGQHRRARRGPRAAPAARAAPSRSSGRRAPRRRRSSAGSRRARSSAAAPGRRRLGSSSESAGMPAAAAAAPWLTAPSSSTASRSRRLAAAPRPRSEPGRPLRGPPKRRRGRSRSAAGKTPTIRVGPAPLTVAAGRALQLVDREGGRRVGAADGGAVAEGRHRRAFALDPRRQQAVVVAAEALEAVAVEACGRRRPRSGPPRLRAGRSLRTSSARVSSRPGRNITL